MNYPEAILVPDNFVWDGLYDQNCIDYVKREVFDERIYDFFCMVKEGDVVVDIGANVGAFTYTALLRKPKIIYCIEPCAIALRSLIKNNIDSFFSESEIVLLNKAIVDSPKILSAEEIQIMSGQEANAQCDGITFRHFIKEYKLDHIDFLKIDCEGGEYDIFTDENIDYLINNVDFIACEFHPQRNLEAFKIFRDRHLRKFKNYVALTGTYQSISFGNFVNITTNLFDDNFMNNLNLEFMIYFTNN